MLYIICVCILQQKKSPVKKKKMKRPKGDIQCTKAQRRLKIAQQKFNALQKKKKGNASQKKKVKVSSPEY